MLLRAFSKLRIAEGEFLVGSAVVLSEQKGLTPSYKLRGDELYVRAVVTSSGAPDVPSEELAFKRAWTQPVGW
jgi:hypothetical protein